MRYIAVILLFLSSLFGGEKVEILEKAKEIKSDIADIVSDYNDYEKWHEYSGLTTLGLAGATILTNSLDRGIHEGLGTAAASGMVITAGLGILAHKDEVFDLSEGWKKEHWHALLGAIAATAMMITLAEAPEEDHATYGVIGGITAGISFVIVKW